jgi:3-oxoadipate enol-lactonase
MVLIHANPFDRRLWMYQAARYSGFYKVINIDLRSYGLSQVVEEPYALSALKEDVLGVLAQEGVSKAIFMGVSVGSGICLLTALDHPEMTRAIVLVGGSPSGPTNVEAITAKVRQASLGQDILGLMQSYTGPGFAESKTGEWALAQFIDRAGDMSAAGISQVFRARAGTDMTPRLPGLKVPTMVVNGEFDGSLERGRLTASLVPGARHHILPGTGHACVIEDPAGFDAAVVPFLRVHGLWRGP